jgi:hypothetical protein
MGKYDQTDYVKRAKKKYEEKIREFVTTIKVSKEVRDKLKAKSIEAGLTMGEYLELLLK